MNRLAKIPVLFCFLFLAFQSKAQEKHFIYIQSENKQSFYVKLNEKTFNSTSSGYLILSQLVSGKYYLVIGFDNHAVQEQNFLMDINTDAGYSLKQFGDKGWGLFDIVNFTTVMADNTETIKQKIKPSPTDGIKQADTSVMITAPKLYAVIKTYERFGGRGIDQVYVDKSETKPDTISIYIPRESNVMTATVKKRCAALATNEDFLQTRAEMAASSNEDMMIQVARRGFKNKCYSISQVKNLSVLFLTESNKLKFFEAIKNNISDIENYGLLYYQFTEPALMEKFKAAEKSN